MELTVEQACPQCGAPVSLPESDHLLRCPYCGVKSYIKTNGLFRFLLPDKLPLEIDRESLVYVPYVRFRGNIFNVLGTSIDSQVLDTSKIALSGAQGLPPTLGLRPQAMKMRRLTADNSGRYLRLTTKPQAILEKVTALTKLSSTGKIERKKVYNWQEIGNGYSGPFVTTVTTRAAAKESYHRAYIGDTLSIIYLPLYQKNDRLFDAILNKPVVTLPDSRPVAVAAGKYNPRWQYRFLSTLCPQCGWNLDGEGDALLLTCNNCETAWMMARDVFKRVSYKIMKDDSAALYLPFWRLAGRIDTLDITSYGDFIRHTNQPLVVRSEWDQRPMSFWIAAFKMRPRVFLQTAKRITLAQHKFEVKKGSGYPNLYPVTLPHTEAKQAVKLTFAACSVDRKNLFPLLPRVNLTKRQTRLVFLPFFDNTHDWVQREAGLAINKNVLKLGRKL